MNLFPTPPPPELRSELNLIASLSLLDDFGIKMLPVQVRLCENKLDLIRNCLDSSPTAYKSVHVVSFVCTLCSTMNLQLMVTAVIHLYIYVWFQLTLITVIVALKNLLVNTLSLSLSLPHTTDSSIVQVSWIRHKH